MTDPQEQHVKVIKHLFGWVRGRWREGKVMLEGKVEKMQGEGVGQPAGVPPSSHADLSVYKNTHTHTHLLLTLSLTDRAAPLPFPCPSLLAHTHAPHPSVSHLHRHGLRQEEWRDGWMDG